MKENGLAGGKAYRDKSVEEGVFHVAAIESDAGGFSPRGFSIDAREDVFEGYYRMMNELMDYLRPYGIELKRGGSGADISPLKAQGGLLIGLRPDTQRYFDFHHTRNDVFENVHPRELLMGISGHGKSGLLTGSARLEMKRVNINGKEFKLIISPEEIKNRVKEMAELARERLKGLDPVFVVIMNGGFMFAADFLRYYGESVDLRFIRIRSYSGTKSTGKALKDYVGLGEVSGRHVVILDDILETGFTMENALIDFREKGAAEVEFICFCRKPEELKYEVELVDVGFDIPPAFVVGYGMDWEERGRNLAGLYALQSV